MPNQANNAATGLEVPFGFYAVKDAEGRATGEVLPIPNVNDRSNSTPALEPLTTAQVVRNAETRARIEAILHGEDLNDLPVVGPEASELVSGLREVLSLMGPTKPENAAAGEVVDAPSTGELDADTRAA